MHKCDHRNCVQPDHLWLGNTQENTNDMIAKGRAIHQPGELHWNVKLIESQVLEIKSLYERGYDKQSIADQFNISYQHVHLIVNNKRWKCLK